MKTIGQSLEKIVGNSDELKKIYKTDLHEGDHLIACTLNSVYNIKILYNGYCKVTGGWFDQQKFSPLKVKILGCTWGSSVIKIDILVACGLCLEFSNGVVTSPVQKFLIIPMHSQN